MQKSIATIGFAALVLTLVSCGMQKENEALKSEVDSLSTQLDQAMVAVDELTEIGVLLDSVESERSIMRIEMTEGGVSRDDYTGRIALLNDILGKAQNKIDNLETDNANVNRMLAKFRNELKEKDRQISAMQNVVDNLSAENITMANAISMLEGEVGELQFEIDAKEMELELMESMVDEMVDVNRITEAEAFYSRGEAYEVAAQRTKLAPRKRKETYKEAMEFYQKAYELGMEEAQPKIEALEKKVN